MILLLKYNNSLIQCPKNIKKEFIYQTIYRILKLLKLI